MKPLEGIKVLDLSRVLAGPYCTMLLGDMGAEVVKIERPETGDDTRGYGPPFINGESAYFMSINRNKRSMTLNLKHDKGIEILHKMVKKADIMVENFRPGKMKDFGLEYESAREINSGLIYCSISGYGHTGPQSHLPGYDLIIQGEGGIASLTGDPDGPPYKVGTSQADIIAGMIGFQGILLALLTRNKTGRGQKVDVGMLDCQVSILTYQAGIYFATGESPERIGNKHPTIAPYETYETLDGYINLGCGNDNIWRKFCKAAEEDKLLEDSRFRTNTDRVQNRNTLNKILKPILKSKSSQTWIDLLRSKGVPCGRIQSVREICEHPQILARDMVLETTHPKTGKTKITGIPTKLSETPGGVEMPPPLLGEHTDEILKDWLNLKEQEIENIHLQGAT